jgi:hypothetical protein
MSEYTIRYNARTNHIHGIAERTTAALVARNRATPVRTTTAGERDAYLARRAMLEGGTAERAKWARVLTSAAVDYLRTPDGDTDSAVAKEHVSDMIGQALHFIAGPGLEREGYTRAATRIETAAKAAARWFLIVERTLDQGTQIEGTVHASNAAIEEKVNRYLQKRDALIMRLEAATVAAVSGRGDF